MRGVTGLLIGGLLVLTGCRAGAGRDTAVVALVAASTKDAVQELADAFTRDTGTAVRISADDTAALAAQITNGAPAHLFISANEKWAEVIRDRGFAHESAPLLSNTLVVIAPADAARPITALADPTIKRLALAGPTVPAGIYARQALKALGLWDALEKRVVSGENVRVALAYVERGEADAGIVYATDARVADRVRQVSVIDPAMHDPIRYPLVLLKAGHDHPAARQFFDHLRSPAATAVFERHGFRPGTP